MRCARGRDATTRQDKTRQDKETMRQRVVTMRHDNKTQRNVAWRCNRTMQWGKANDETQHDNATTSRTSGHGKWQRRDDERQRRCDERGGEAAEIFFLIHSHRFQGGGRLCRMKFNVGIDGEELYICI